MGADGQIPGLAHVAGAATAPEDALAGARAWIAENVPATWRAAAVAGGPAEVREMLRG
jgi:hypothetical protein